MAGVYFLLASLFNDRSARVEEYDAAVQRWTLIGRPNLAAAAFNVALHFNTSESIPDVGSNSTLILSMERSEEADWNFNGSDSEGADGIDSFESLKFVANITVPKVYNHNSHASSRVNPEVLPSRADAATVRFVFSATSNMNESSALRGGSIDKGHFATKPFPLRFVEEVRARTPAPGIKCSHEQHGIWRDGRCYVMKVLTRVCMQIEADNRRMWQLKAGESEGGIGCDPQNHWDVAKYVIDPCWAKHAKSHCTSPLAVNETTNAHIVELTLRSSDDPLLYAERLTNNQFDFGLAAPSQHVLGFSMLALGAFMSCPFVLFIGRCLR
jgi:hypothetical protein